MRIHRALVVLFFAGALSGCGGSSSTPVAPARTPATSAPQNTSQAKVTTSLKILIPGRGAKSTASDRRKRDYVSSATAGLIGAFVDSSGNTTYQGYALAAGASATVSSPATCTSASSANQSFTCTLTFSLAPDTYDVTLTTYDYAQSGTSGVVASGSTQANALSIQTQSSTVTADQDNPFSFVLEGIVENFTTTPFIGLDGLSSTSSAVTFAAYDADQVQIDTIDSASNFAYGTQNGGPFTEDALFPIAASDVTSCSSSSACLTTTDTSVANPASEGVAFTYNGDGSAGDFVSVQPYHGKIVVSAPGNSAKLVGAKIVPLFALVDQSNAAATGTSTVAFTTPSQSITGYAAQFHPPTNAPQDGSGYAVDASSCATAGTDSTGSAGPVATVDPTTIAYSPNFGASFTIASTTYAGECLLTVSDGAGDSQTITVNNTSSGVVLTHPTPQPTVQPNGRRR